MKATLTLVGDNVPGPGVVFSVLLGKSRKNTYKMFR